VGNADVLAFSNLTNAMLRDGFRYIEKPTLQSLSPSSTVANTEAKVTLVGTALTAESRVLFGSTEAEVLYRDSTGLIVTAPARDAGLVDVTVETADGITTLADAFMYVGQPQGGVEMFHVMPKTGPTTGGQEVALTILGVPDMVGLTVSFGDTPATVVSVEPDQGRMRLLTPPGNGLVDVTVDSPVGSNSLPSAYSYVDPLSIESVMPEFGAPEGGEVVVITGEGLEEALEVRIGALPASILSSAPGQVTVESPPGSPGLSDVTVLLESTLVVAEDAFDYVPPTGLELYALAPNYGAVAGNTLLRVYGAGFNPDAVVRFEKQQLKGVEFISSSELWVRTPKADEAISVDVSVEQAGGSETLVDAFTYFDPYSPYGGSWGSPIDGTINITVLDLYTTDPVANALVMLWDDPATPYQGLTDDRGQITFSHPNLVGAQMVTAAKAQYTAFSVVEYDAENVTVHLIPFNPPSDGSGGGGGTALPFGYLTGQVDGLGKYVVVPPQTCQFLSEKGVLEGDHCSPCGAADECSEGFACTEVAGSGFHCLQSCVNNDDCPDWFVCGPGADGTSACVPDPGEKAAYCQTTNHTIFQPPPAPQTPVLPLDDGSRAWIDDAGNYAMKTRLGELAVLCFGGVIRDPSEPNDSFLPLALGVRRNVEPKPGEEFPGQDVTLDIPLSKDVPIRLDGVPQSHVSNALGIPTPVSTVTRLRVAWDFGAEGYWTAFDEIEPLGDEFVVAHQPESLAGPLDGLTYSFLAQVAGGPTAESGTRASNVSVIDVNRTFEFQNGAWLTTDSGIRRDVLSVWAIDQNDLWAVGADGLLAHYVNGYWFSQPTPTYQHLHSLYGTAWDHIVSVGDSGTAIHFDGVTWQEEDTGTLLSLRGVWGGSPGYYVAVGDGIALARTDGVWSEIPDAPGVMLNAVWGPSVLDFYAVGADGRVYPYQGGWLEPIDLGVSDSLNLLSVSGTANDNIWVVGSQGAVFHYDGVVWERMEQTTLATLYDVHVRPDGQVFAVGARGTLLRFDGNGWSLTPPPKHSGDLRAVWAFDNIDEGAVAVGVQAVTLGPMLQFPTINEPTALEGQFTWHLDWSVAGGPLPTFNFIEMLYAGNFPAWWTVAAAESVSVDFPNLIEAGVSPFPGAGMTMKVNRVYKPGATVDNFDFWDTYDQSAWQSWAYDSVPFNPFIAF
jgi:hypothetical protein